MKTAYQKGVDAEGVAERYFKKAKYKVLARRYKTKFGEVDLVLFKDGVVVFVEVKQRRNLEDSLYAITPKNRRRVEQAALYFMSQHEEYADAGMRFDVFVVGWDGDKIVSRHLDNAWEAGA
ncbi:MAG: YraN family protein [Alphaproteobacteria bacterium]